MEKEKKKFNLKIIVLIIIAILVFSGIAILNKLKLDKLEEEWKEKPELVGDLCINVVYYTKLIKEDINSTGRTREEAQETEDEIKEFGKEIDKQAKEVKNLFNKLDGKPKTKSQQRFYNNYIEVMRLYDKMSNVTDKYTGYNFMLWVGGRASSAKADQACEEILQDYVDNIKYHIVYSKDNKTLTERKNNIDKGIVSNKLKQEIKDKYGW